MLWIDENIPSSEGKGNLRYGILRKRKGTGPSTRHKTRPKSRDAQETTGTKRRKGSGHGAVRNEQKPDNTPKVVRILVMTYYGMRQEGLNHRPHIEEERIK